MGDGLGGGNGVEACGVFSFFFLALRRSVRRFFFRVDVPFQVGSHLYVGFTITNPDFLNSRDYFLFRLTRARKSKYNN